MVKILTKKLDGERRNKVVVDIPESGLIVQNFFKGRDFKAAKVIEDEDGEKKI